MEFKITYSYLKSLLDKSEIDQIGFTKEMEFTPLEMLEEFRYNKAFAAHIAIIIANKNIIPSALKRRLFCLWCVKETLKIDEMPKPTDKYYLDNIKYREKLNKMCEITEVFLNNKITRELNEQYNETMKALDGKSFVPRIFIEPSYASRFWYSTTSRKVDKLISETKLEEIDKLIKSTYRKKLEISLTTNPQLITKIDINEISEKITKEIKNRWSWKRKNDLYVKMIDDVRFKQMDKLKEMIIS